MRKAVALLVAAVFCFSFSAASPVLRNVEPTQPPVALPVVLNTWPFSSATTAGWKVLSTGGSPMDAVLAAGSTCEAEQCDGSVGYGGSPDENGETTLDAMVMDGDTMDVGSVGCLRRVKSAMKVAHAVLEFTEETLLAGELATAFAVRMGFQEETLSTNHSVDLYDQWLQGNCTPNFWKPPLTSPACPDNEERGPFYIEGHDTIGVLAVNDTGHVSCGTTTNGASHKIPGRVGDSPIAGAGAYCDSEVGGAVATGDGDVMMRFLPTFRAVELMRIGFSPSEACTMSLEHIVKKYPKTSGAVVCVNNKGEYGAARLPALARFPYCLANPKSGGVQVVTV